MGNKKILIVDDDPDVLKSMHIRLKANHYDTFFAADAISCIAEARKTQPDLVILDLGLPAGDGFLVMERMKAVPALASIPIIVVSARDVRLNQQRALQAGAKAFLQKPVNNSELLAVIRQALEEPVKRESPVIYDLGRP
ncbi:MAG TPA: response regulator [Acidobacteriaceae bacterium]|nr:response regulator [Acidobacteriaceae bacterium]